MISGANLDLSHAMTSWGRWPLSALLGTCRIFWSCNMWIAPWTRRQRSCDATMCLIALLAQIVSWFVELCRLTHTRTHAHRRKYFARYLLLRVSCIFGSFLFYLFLSLLLHFIVTLIFFPPLLSLLALASGKFPEWCHRATMFWLINKL